VPLLLGGGPLPAAICVSARAARNAVGPTAAGQPAGAASVAASAPWIEPAQSFEKNQLGLGNVFFNSLRFTWTMALLADAAVLLRARALLERPPLRPPLLNLMPFQLPLELEDDSPASFFSKAGTNPQNSQ
jgi:hypothetical protein